MLQPDPIMPNSLYKFIVSTKYILYFNQRANSSVRSNYSSTRSQKSTATDVLRRLRDEYNDFTNGINLSAYQKKMITPSDIFKE